MFNCKFVTTYHFETEIGIHLFVLHHRFTTFTTYTYTQILYDDTCDMKYTNVIYFILSKIQNKKLRALFDNASL